MIGHIHKSGLMKRSAPLICVVNYSSNAGGRPADNNDRGKIRHARIAKPFSRPLSPVGAPAEPGWRARSARLARPLSPVGAPAQPGQPHGPSGPGLPAPAPWPARRGRAARCRVAAGPFRVGAGRALPSPGCPARRRLSKLTFALANPPAGTRSQQLQIVIDWRLVSPGFRPRTGPDHVGNLFLCVRVCL
jgi:hypothetical protein